MLSLQLAGRDTMRLRCYDFTHRVYTMMHPAGNCNRCGHRLFTHVEGGEFCANCGDNIDRSGSHGMSAVVADD